MDQQTIAQMLGNYGEFVGSIAVLATLVYLSLQVRQNNRALDQQNEVAAAEILQARADSVMGLAALGMTNDANLPVIRSLLDGSLSPESLDPDDSVRAALFLTATRANLENAFLQYRRGFLPEDFYQDVTVPNLRTYGPALLRFGLPLTAAFRAELNKALGSSPNDPDQRSKEA
jgi:hypothetical protein